MNTVSLVTAGDRAPFVEGWSEIGRVLGADLRFLVTQQLVQIADLSHQAAEELGNSYRGFNVGSAVLALDTEGQRTGIYFHGNYTPYKGADWNCAEKRAFEVVSSRGFDKVLAVAVTGPLQADSVSGVESPTLHPCVKCRAMLAGSELAADDTLVVTSNLEQTEFEIFDRTGLLALHETGEEQPFPDYHPMLPLYWDQLTRMKENEAVDLAEREIFARMAANR